ncbi:FeoC-like transcriptional regulator [uncultured Endozoicomonas sp.]|uniref:FeoC-like transcriptional regulator n=1 Tax=uncultured Endozoicomonas sp. TaxID=432652 RepID=UPI00261613C3|nr:FeoC-like transcriptional regulator [uncultured Endozoicomonas sp.]
MLIAIRDYLKEQKVCSLADLSVKFKTTPEAMRGMLSHWLRKGQVICESPQCFTACKKGCVSCDPAELEIYRWKGREALGIPLTSIS